jgi:hypothetical protein
VILRFRERAIDFEFTGCVSTYCERKYFPTRGDKAVRCQSIIGGMAMQGLRVPINRPWYPAFRAELLSFPRGKHDDQCDALGLIGQLLVEMVPGTPRPPPPPPRLKVISTDPRSCTVTLEDLWENEERRSRYINRRIR